MSREELEAALAREQELRERVRVFGRIQEALVRLRDVGSVDAMIARAPAEVARACDMDRAVDLPGGRRDARRGGVLHRRRRRGRGRAAGVQPRAPARRCASRCSRARCCASGARWSSRTPTTTRCPTSRSSGATGPTPTSRRRSCPRAASSGSCTATRACAAPRDPHGVDELDRDALWAFAEGFGYAVERMQMLERLRAQGDEVRALIARTEAIVSEHLAAQVELASRAARRGGDRPRRRSAAARRRRPDQLTHAPRARGPRADRRRRDEQPDRRPPRHRREHREVPRQADPAPPRRSQPRRSRVDLPAQRRASA